MPGNSQPARRRFGVAALTVAGALLLAPVAEALPQPGEPLPSFSAKDLNGADHQSHELRGHRTLVVAMTDRDGGDAMQKWFDTADARLGKGHYHSQSLISLRLPFFVSAGAARNRAKERVPQEFWGDTWLDKDGSMARLLSLPQGRESTAFVLDAQGRVVASVHGPPDSPEAGRIWSAMTHP